MQDATMMVEPSTLGEHFSQQNSFPNHSSVRLKAYHVHMTRFAVLSKGLC
jgi:hypothetical protein